MHARFDGQIAKLRRVEEDLEALSLRLESALENVTTWNGTRRYEDCRRRLPSLDTTQQCDICQQSKKLSDCRFIFRDSVLSELASNIDEMATRRDQLISDLQSHNASVTPLDMESIKEVIQDALQEVALNSSLIEDLVTPLRANVSLIKDRLTNLEKTKLLINRESQPLKLRHV